jgi:predicted phosphodiesterase
MNTKKIAIQIFSDLHVDIKNKLYEIPVKAKYLFLVGNICQLNHNFFYIYFNYFSTNWEKVFYIPGNYEFYSTKKNYNELDFEYNLKLKEKYKNVYYLNDSFAKLNDDIDVYGSIFWTIPKFASTYEAKLEIKDYANIKYFNTKLNYVTDLEINYIKEIAINSFTSLKTHIEKTNKTTIIMTHFPPLRECTTNPNTYNQSEIVKNYSSWDDKSINNLKLNNVPLWISGHTHWSYNIKKNDCNFISNQLGYKHEEGHTCFNHDGLYELLYE